MVSLGNLRDLSIKQKKVKDWEYSSVTKCLPIVCKVIGPIPSTIEIAILKISVMVSIAYIYHCSWHQLRDMSLDISMRMLSKD